MNKQTREQISETANKTKTKIQQGMYCLYMFLRYSACIHIPSWIREVRAIKLDNPSISQIINLSVHQSIMKQLVNRSIGQLVNRSIDQSINLSIGQLINRSIDQSVNRSIGKSVNRSIGQSVNQSINQSVNHHSAYLQRPPPSSFNCKKAPFPFFRRSFKYF